MIVSAHRAAATFFQHRRPRRLSFKVPSMRKSRDMTTEMCCMKTSVPVSGSSIKIDNNCKGLVNCMTESDAKVVKDKVTESSVEIDVIRNDPGRLNRMTVRELRETARSIGISTKGSKKDLLAALMCFPCKEESESENRASKDEKVPCDIPLKRKSNDSLGDDEQDFKTVSGDVEKKYKRRGIKQHSFESTSTKNHLTSTKKMLLVDETEVLDTDKSSCKRTKPLLIHSDEQVMEVASSSIGHDEPWTILAHKKPQAGWIPYNPKIMRLPHPSRETSFCKLMSWNVNGLRALLRMERSSMLQLVQREDFDILCLQETKMKEKDVEELKDILIEGYGNSYWTCSVSKLGYSGTAIISRIKPISVKYGLGIPDHDSEGRLITAEFEKFYLINAYVPNSGDGLKRLDYRIKQWDPTLGNYLKELERSKPVILTGDLNCAHEEIDIYNPAGNRRSAGFTWEERESFETNFLSKGFIDTFRKQHPDVLAYTFWGYRHGGRRTNKGWRLDYFLVSESLAENTYDSFIVPDVGGSDHCPIGLILNI